MKIFLTSTLGRFRKDADGNRIPALLPNDNGLIDRLKSIWVKDSNVLLIASAPEEHAKNDDMSRCLKASFEMSGLSVSAVRVCDARSTDIADKTDVILLCGGHVPSQNRFFSRIGLKEKLNAFHGTLIGISAGSMNCAETVYAPPENDGEAVDPGYTRRLSGLGLTKFSILPHFQYLKTDILDGLRMMEDIILPDSTGHEYIAINDGSYIAIQNGKHILYGEAYRIKDGSAEQICANGASCELDWVSY